MNYIGQPKSLLPTPALWVDLDKLEQNIHTLATLFKKAAIDWRPHVKGIKTPAIAHKLIEAGAIGVTCAKLSEAEVMVSAGIHEILIANQIVDLQKIRRLAHLKKHANVIAAVDNRENVLSLGAIASDIGVTVPVLIEVDTGMNRAGTLPGQPTVDLAKLISQTDGVSFMGLMAWEGHTIGLPSGQKEEAIETAVTLLMDTAVQCQQAGFNTPIISGGGSGTYLITPQLSGVTEIQAGGAIFNDMAYQKWGVQTSPCLFVQTQVTSRPTPSRIIIDAGFKALPSWASQPQPINLDVSLTKYRSSAEHGVLELASENHTVKIGEKIDFIVGYTDATLFLYDVIFGVRDGIVEVAWEIAGRGKLQ